MTGESTAARHETSSMANEASSAAASAVVGGVQEDGASADSRGQAAREHRQGECPGAVRLGGLALKCQRVGAGQVNDAALFGLGRDEPDLFAVGRRDGNSSQFHVFSSGVLFHTIRTVSHWVYGVAIGNFVGGRSVIDSGGPSGPQERFAVAEFLQTDVRRKHVQALTDLGQQLQSAVIHRKRAGP